LSKVLGKFFTFFTIKIKKIVFSKFGHQELGSRSRTESRSLFTNSLDPKHLVQVSILYKMIEETARG
jgi:hypothetical protein